MPLKTTSELTIDRLAMVLYGAPEAGKTTLAATALNPVIIDFDKLAYKASIEAQIWEVNCWEDAVALITAQELHYFDTIVIDTLSSAQQMLEESLRKEPKLISRVGPTRDGWMRIANDFRLFVEAFKNAGKNVIVVAHENVIMENDRQKYEPKCKGSFMHDIKQFIPVIGRMYAEDKKRILDFSFDEKQMTKGDMLGRIEDPQDLQEIINDYEEKARKNRVKKTKALIQIGEIKEILSKIDSISTLNAAIEGMKDLPRPIKLQVAKEFEDTVKRVEGKEGELQKTENGYERKPKDSDNNSN